MLRRSIAALRGESAVPTLLTLVVSAWFLAAGVAIFADRADARPRAEPAAAQAAKGCATPSVLAEWPAMHETILVEAARTGSVVAEGPAVHETILVEARRG
ncbi:MAG TPA: hypothetical protein VN782_12390 [Usitatibacter sp.]|nr:hypothetical protein [Usitatibacter sp.]